MSLPSFHEAIVYVDESGDHGASSPEYPVFVLAFCIFEKRIYAEQITTAIQQFKFKYFGHDVVVLHERDIRKSLGPFSLLIDPSIREEFMSDLNNLIESSPFTLIASVIRKDQLAESRWKDANPYHLAMKFCIERLKMHLKLKDGSPTVHVVFEARGKREDNELELEFRRLAQSNLSGANLPLISLFGHKHSSYAGMELADLVARPIGRHILNPAQPNRGWDILKKKFRQDPQGNIKGWGLKVFP